MSSENEIATVHPLEHLLSQLSSGGSEAVQRVFVAFEPYLRMVVRRQLTPALRVRFDSMDIVQSIWADLLTRFQAGHWHFATPQQLQAFLVKVTRNRLIDRVRQQQTSLRREQRLEGSDLSGLPHSTPARVGEQLEADEMWQRLLTLCPPQHRELLDLKRQGLSLAEVAVRTGLHEGSVRRILYKLAARLALDEDRPEESPRVRESESQGGGPDRHLGQGEAGGGISGRCPAACEVLPEQTLRGREAFPE